MIIVYFLRGLVNIFFYLILAGSALGAVVGIGVAIYRAFRPKIADRARRTPRVMQRPPK